MLTPIDIIFDSDQIGTEQVSGSRDSPQFTLLPSIENCVGVSVTYANVPFTYFVIDGTNKTFLLDINTGSPSPVTITLTEGTYNIVNIVTQLKSQIDAATVWDAGVDYDIFIDSTTSKLVIYKLTNISTTFSIDFSSNQLGKILGFEKILYTSTSTTIINDSDVILSARHNVQAPRVINLSGPAQMFLDSDLGSVLFGSVRNQSGTRGLLGFWPVNCNYQGTIEYLNPNPEMIPITKTNISKIQLSLTVGNQAAYSINGVSTSHLQLNGEPFQVGLRFWKEVSDNKHEKDAMGNVTTSVREISGSVYAPKKILKRTW
jgi:hypothetical protein